MPTKFNNSFIIRNKNVVSGLPSSDPVKLIELLDKIGVIKKSRAKKRGGKVPADAKAQSGDSGDLKGYTEIKEPKGLISRGPIIEEPEDTSSRFPSRPMQRVSFPQPPALTYLPGGPIESIQNMNKMIEDKKAELQRLETSSNPQIEDIKRQTQYELARLTDANQKLAEDVRRFGTATGWLGGELSQIKSGVGGALSQIQQRLNRPDFIAGIPAKQEPFKYVEGMGDAVEFTENEQPDTEENPMENQGSQDIPEDVLKVDVSPIPEEIMEEEETEPMIQIKESSVMPEPAVKKPRSRWEDKITARLGIENKPPYRESDEEDLRDYLSRLSEKTGFPAKLNTDKKNLWGQIGNQLDEQRGKKN
jgi:hypothetical protein